ncbi:carbon storage regulator [Arthrobacter sp. C9C5]|uniref:carbon storage regulator n=1 Tax=Arthrobacter sp. C9C5 TaxID=2735267 RepID=UPI0015853B71|nr:carbon storage regulator [Arthrobacter sp. C9C5]NUU31212.1 carbon storage regulator [Arthrobacter sp. C9C5]
MLVLTRKPGEQIMIGDGIVITVLEGRGDGVRIGIEAPRGVPIQRREVIEAIAAANLAAAEAGAESGPGTEDALRGLLPPAAAPSAEAGRPTRPAVD